MLFDIFYGNLRSYVYGSSWLFISHMHDLHAINVKAKFIFNSELRLFLDVHISKHFSFFELGR